MQGHRYHYDRTRGVWVTDPRTLDLDTPADSGELTLAFVGFGLAGILVGLGVALVGAVLTILGDVIGWTRLVAASGGLSGLAGVLATIRRPDTIRRHR